MQKLILQLGGLNQEIQVESLNVTPLSKTSSLQVESVLPGGFPLTVTLPVNGVTLVQQIQWEEGNIHSQLVVKDTSKHVTTVQTNPHSTTKSATSTVSATSITTPGTQRTTPTTTRTRGSKATSRKRTKKPAKTKKQLIQEYIAVHPDAKDTEIAAATKATRMYVYMIRTGKDVEYEQNKRAKKVVAK